MMCAFKKDASSVQLFLSFKGGMGPSRSLEYAEKNDNLDSSERSSGMVPVSRFSWRVSKVRFAVKAEASGILPVKAFWCSVKTSNELKFVKHDGMGPFNALSCKNRVFKRGLFPQRSKGFCNRFDWSCTTAKWETGQAHRKLSYEVAVQI